MSEHRPSATQTMIRLDGITKSYPGQDAAAVEELSLAIPEGETVCFVGPSGCGKTTTMKLINRLIEPTSGRIYLNGRDVTNTRPELLRRHMGYSIQQTGLFPHRTVAENIETVPRLLKWGRARIKDRVDELLTMMEMKPDRYRDRYPKQLSGGQQQRVGVARAMAADPPVMLMDEPFGAIDPLTRETLQNELLRIQRDIQKTIVFVTHDIDEAVKLGDRIAIFSEGGRVAQYDTPRKILTEPADEFVAEFIGSGAFVRRLGLTRLADVDVDTLGPTISENDDHDTRVATLTHATTEFVLVLDHVGKPSGWLAATLPPSDERIRGHGLPVLSRMVPENTLYDALDSMLGNNANVVVVTDDQGRYRGTMDMDWIQTLIHSEGASGDGTRKPRATGSQREKESR